MVYIENTAGKITFHEDWEGLLLVAEGLYTLATFQELGNKILEVSEVNSIKTLMIDARRAEIIPQDVISWMENDWYPAIVKTGIERIAFVVPTIGIAELTLRKANKKMELLNQIEIEYFGRWEKAKSWLNY